MKRTNASTLIGVLAMVGGGMILCGLACGNVQSATPTMTVPGPYPYETPMQLPVPPSVTESSPLPSPAPFPYPDTIAPAPGRNSRTASARRPVSAKAVRKAAFKYNGVANFCQFLAVLPADVSVFDPKLGRTRSLVKGGRVVRKNVGWLHKHKQGAAHDQNGGT